jgi:hypothetical protein
MQKTTYQPFPELHVFGALIVGLAGLWASLLVYGALAFNTYCGQPPSTGEVWARRVDMLPLVLGFALVPLLWAGLTRLVRADPRPWLIVTCAWMLVSGILVLSAQPTMWCF